MSDFLKHECGIALVRLLKPLAYYQEKYGTSLYGFNQLFLLMEKQHNRGQDGAGIGCVKLDVDPGKPYIARKRSIEANPLSRIFQGLQKDYHKKVSKGTIHPEFPDTVKQHFDFGGEVLLGHLRYGTSGVYSTENCHPFVRQSNWPTKNLMLAGNFNMTNVKELFSNLIELGQHPKEYTDTITVMEKIGHFLDDAVSKIYKDLKKEGYNILIARMEPENNIETILDGASSATNKMPFLVVGNPDANSFGKRMKEKFEGTNIRFLGAIYDKEVLNTLRIHSYLYFHGHSVGGTNPSLLEAMANKARDMGVNLLISGHSHELKTSENKGSYFLNPGSMTGAYSVLKVNAVPSFMILEFKSTEIVIYEYSLVDG